MFRILPMFVLCVCVGCNTYLSRVQKVYDSISACDVDGLKRLVDTGDFSIFEPFVYHAVELEVPPEKEIVKQGMIEFLLERDFSPNSKVPDSYAGRRPLFIALYECPQYAKVLLAHGAYAEDRDYEDCTPLYLALRFDLTDIAFTLINRYDADCTVECSRAKPLHAACWSTTDLELVRLVCSKTYEVDRLDRMGSAPLHLCAMRTDYDFAVKVAEILVDHGAKVDVKARNGEDMTPLYLAAATGNLKLVSFLISKGANVNKGANHGTVLHAALASGDVNKRYDMARILLEAGADPNAKDEFGNTPLDLVPDDDGSKYKKIRALLKKFGAKENRSQKK